MPDELHEIQIRPFRLDVDDIEELTELVHRAYKQLADMGLNYTAVDQDSTVTRRRIRDCYCLIAEINGSIVGTVSYYAPGLNTYCDWYARDGVSIIGQFAVLPEYQGSGIGSRLLSFVEAMAINDGSKELALDTAEPAVHLHRFYGKRGYRHVDYANWEGKTYRSVIMSKKLTEVEPHCDDT